MRSSSSCLRHSPSLIHRRTRGRADPLVVLAIVFLLRCVLDPGNFVYYSVPLVLALLVWETLGTSKSLPVATLLTCTAVWLSFDVMLSHASAPETGFAYIGWTTVLLLYLSRQLSPAEREAAAGAADSTGVTPYLSQATHCTSLTGAPSGSGPALEWGTKSAVGESYASAAVRRPSSARSAAAPRSTFAMCSSSSSPSSSAPCVDLVAVDAGRERRLLQLLAHRLRLQAVEAGRAHERRRRGRSPRARRRRTASS